MRSRKGVLVLLLLVFLKAFSFENAHSSYIQLSSQDTLEIEKLPKAKLPFQQRDDEACIQERLKRLEGKSGDLSTGDLKKLAILYAYLEDSEKSAAYLQRYIKQR